MKKTILTTLMALGTFGSFNAMAQNCVIELQFEGSVLGQNTFVGATCIDAMRDCKRTQKAYERRLNFSQNDLSCERVGNIGGGNTGGGYNPPHGGGNNGGNTGGGYNPPHGGGNNGGNTGGGYNPPHGGGNNGGYYTNFQALTDLENMENDNNQAREVYNLILDYVDQGSINLKVAVDLYETILIANGGANSTDASKSVLAMLINESVATGLHADVLGNAYVRMVNAENDDDQAKENLRLVLNAAQANNVDPVLALDTFTSLLETSGANATDEVRGVFNRFITIRRVSIDKAIRDYTTIANLENGADDAMSNYELVLSAARTPSIRYRDAFSTMVELLERHGANATSEVQRKFRDIFRL